jgi:hypothetical protein
MSTLFRMNSKTPGVKRFPIEIVFINIVHNLALTAGNLELAVAISYPVTVLRGKIRP